MVIWSWIGKHFYGNHLACQSIFRDRRTWVAHKCFFSAQRLSISVFNLLYYSSFNQHAGVAQLVERQLPKLNVESSNLFSRSLEIAPIRAIFLFLGQFRQLSCQLQHFLWNPKPPLDFIEFLEIPARARDWNVKRFTRESRKEYSQSPSLRWNPVRKWEWFLFWY